jgi:hypothetical protein
VKIGTADEGRMLPHIDLHRVVTSGVCVVTSGVS